MTEVSYLWNGTTIGDADQAPYYDHHLNDYLYFPQLNADTDYAYVVPGYLNDLRVTRGGDGIWGVNIASGAALVKNRLYISDDNVSLAVDPPTTNFGRYDLIVLRYDLISQKIRAAVVKGNEAPDASTARIVPALTQNALIWEIQLALVLITGIGAADAYDYVFYGSVRDMRRFLPPKPSADLTLNTNLIRNSEFMAFSDPNNGPEFWFYSGTSLNSSLNAPPYDQMVRGRGVGWIGTLGTYVPAKRDIKTYTIKGLVTMNDSHSAYMTMRISAQQESGVTTTIHEVFFQARDIPDNSAYEFCETFVIPDTVEDTIGLSIQFITNSVLGAQIGQIILVPGYYPGSFRQFNEVIPFRVAITDAAWSDTAKSSGTTTINLTASFAGSLFTDAILHGTKAVLVRLVGRDSASAANPTITLAIRGYAAPYNTDYLILEVGSITNNVYRERYGVLPINQPSFSAHAVAPQFRAVVVASGAGTFDATIELIGIIT